MRLHWIARFLVIFSPGIVLSEVTIREERWIAEKLFEEDAYSYDGPTQFFSPLAVSSEDDFFYVRTTAALEVKVTHLVFEGGVLKKVADGFLVDAAFRTSSSWKHQYSIGIDEGGYLHVAGDMDEYPFFEERHAHLPSDLKGKTCLLWRSSQPLNVTEFVFKGDLAAGAGCPIGTGLSRLKFVNDEEGRLYAHYRNIGYIGDPDAGGWGQGGDRGMGMSRFDATAEEWLLIGGNWRPDLGDESRTALFIEPEVAAEEYREVYRDVSFARVGEGSLMTVVVLLHHTGGFEYAVVAYSEDHGTTFFGTDGVEQTLPITLLPPSDIAADTRVDYEFGSQVSTARLPGGGLKDVYTFVHETAEDKKLWVRTPMTGSGWKFISFPGLENAAVDDVTEQNYVFYDDKDIPTMIGKEGIYRFRSNIDFAFHPLDFSRLQVFAPAFRRTKQMYAVSLLDAAAGQSSGRLAVVRVRLEELADEEWLPHPLHSVEALHRPYAQIFSPLASWGRENFFFVYVTPALEVKVTHVLFMDDEVTVIHDGYLVDESFRTVAGWQHQYSIGIDEGGILHVAGDMDEYPYFNKKHIHLPEEYQKKTCLIWRSVQPADATEFVFKGDLDDGLGCPIGNGFARMRFVNDEQGRLYAHYRTLASIRSADYILAPTGDRGLGMSRFDVEDGKWVLIGGEWAPEGEQGQSVLFTEKQADNDRLEYDEFWRDVNFDGDGRLHVVVQLREPPTDGTSETSLPIHFMYATSADHGTTWTHFDGTEISSLPITTASGDKVEVFASDRTVHSQVAVGKGQGGQVLAFCAVDEKFEARSSPDGEGDDWGVASEDAFPPPVIGEGEEQNFVYYDGGRGIPTMIWQKGINRWKSEEDVLSHALQWGKLQVDQGYARGSSHFAALGIEWTDPDSSNIEDLTLLLIGPELDLPTKPPPTEPPETTTSTTTASIATTTSTTPTTGTTPTTSTTPTTTKTTTTTGRTTSAPSTTASTTEGTAGANWLDENWPFLAMGSAAFVVVAITVVVGMLGFAQDPVSTVPVGVEMEDSVTFREVEQRESFTEDHFVEGLGETEWDDDLEKYYV